MEIFSSLTRHSHRKLPNFIFLFLSFVIIQGCVSSGKPKFHTESYLIDYPAPVFENLGKIDDTIRVSRFTIATAYNSSNMIFRSDGYEIDSFNYNRWAANPADMVGDTLLRDLQQSGLFHAAFSRYTVDEGRYNVQGGIPEFYLRITQNGHSAVVSLEIALIDTKQRDTTKRILFQKKYQHEETLRDASPRGYCEAASITLQLLSKQIITDIYQELKKSGK